MRALLANHFRDLLVLGHGGVDPFIHCGGVNERNDDGQGLAPHTWEIRWREYSTGVPHRNTPSGRKIRAQSEGSQIQNVGVGHAAVVDFARGHAARSVTAGTAGASDIDAALGSLLARPAIVVCSHKR